ncbi:MAG: ankyrin repeat domain-containing protein, partial [Gammaproteobacteria bacterium]|nr:ankyrin repeat domain-containing protein [Gammaproteobacteria bacterium]
PLDIDTTENALLIAAGLGYGEICQALLTYGVNIDARGKNRRTPIMAAIAFDHPETVSLLLKAKADTTAKDAEGNSLLDLAENKPKIQALLTKAGVR